MESLNQTLDTLSRAIEDLNARLYTLELSARVNLGDRSKAVMTEEDLRKTPYHDLTKKIRELKSTLKD